MSAIDLAIAVQLGRYDTDREGRALFRDRLESSLRYATQVEADAIRRGIAAIDHVERGMPSEIVTPAMASLIAEAARRDDCTVDGDAITWWPCGVGDAHWRVRIWCARDAVGCPVIQWSQHATRDRFGWSTIAAFLHDVGPAITPA